VTPDTVKRAYAILGLDPASSSSQVKERYKALVKKWHPDRFARDAASQTEATARMRMINDAYHLILRRTPHPEVDVGPAPEEEIRFSRSTTGGQPGRRLTREEIEALVASINGSQIWLPWEPPWLEQALRRVMDRPFYRASRVRLVALVRLLKAAASRVPRRGRQRKPGSH
jgi:hypothetical protein